MFLLATSIKIQELRTTIKCYVEKLQHIGESNDNTELGFPNPYPRFCLSAVAPSKSTCPLQ